MAEKKKASQTNDSSVTRIRASKSPKVASKETSTKKVVEAKVTKDTSAKKTKKRSAKGIARPFVAFGRYFAGAWYELKQVRWPTRRATWGLTFAVLVYTAFFIVLVILLDIGFKYLFDLILGK